jgi:arsenate reductase
MAECAMNRWGGARFRGFSAGSHPRNAVHPTTVQLLKQLKYDAAGLRSKNWNEFAEPNSPPLDFVFTLCDRAVAEACPTWPGKPIQAHWVVQDPAAVVGSRAARRRAFVKVHTELEQRIRIFTALPIETLERFALERWVTEIGKLSLAA